MTDAQEVDEKQCLVSEISDADRLFSNGEYKEAFLLYSKYPEDRHSKMRLGKMYLMGWGTKKRPLKGYGLLQESADKSDPESLFELGHCVFEGIGTQADKDRGFELLMESAESGYAPAEDMVGEIYAEGRYGDVDYKEALKWFGRAVEHNYPKGNYHLALLYKTTKFRNVDSYLENIRIAVDAKIPEAVGELGFRYYQGEMVEKDTEKGIKMLEYAADHGETKAAIVLGLNYTYESNDFKSAKKYLKKALDGGNDQALSVLGDLYSKEGKNIDKAVDYYRKASEKGDIRSTRRCGMLLITEDDHYGKAEGFRMLKEAAEKGDIESMGQVGYCYLSGTGVCEDIYEAFKWFHTGADNGDAYSKYRLSEMYFKGITVDKSVKLARRFLKEAFEAGFSHAAFNLAQSYEFDKESQSLPDAIYWYEQGAEAGDPDSIRELAKHYESGSSIKGSDEKAYGLYQRAYDITHSPESAAELGRCLQEGIGVEPDIDQAIKKYEEAAKSNGFAMRRLCEIYRERDDFSDRSVFWLRRSADKGIMQSIKELAVMYEEGDGVHRSYKLAMEWYHEASEKGDKQSKKRFEELLFEDHDDEHTGDTYQSLAYRIGECYEDDCIIEMANRLIEGDGVPKDLQRARAWLEIGELFYVDGCKETIKNIDGLEKGEGTAKNQKTSELTEFFGDLFDE